MMFFSKIIEKIELIQSIIYSVFDFFLDFWDLLPRSTSASSKQKDWLAEKIFEWKLENVISPNIMLC